MDYSEISKLIDDSCTELVQELNLLQIQLPVRIEQITRLGNRVIAIQESLRNPSPISVALLGVTGAGKSSLVNAIIGEDLVPWSDFATCTAGIARIKYRKGQGYSIRVTFISRESWEDDLLKMRNQISWLNEPAEQNENGAQEEPLGTGIRALVEEDRNRLTAVYGSSAVNEFAQSLAIESLTLPEGHAYAFKKGFDEQNVSTIEEAKETLEMYLSTANIEGEVQSGGQFWPIVESVLIEGEFPGIVEGAELVDLPGVNDANKAREQKTIDFLADAKFIFVANWARALFDARTVSVLKSRNVLNRVLAKNTPGVLTFIGTKSDAEFRRGSSIFIDFPERESASRTDLALYRTDKWREKYRNELIEFAQDNIPESDDTEQVAQWTEAITSSPIFLTSSRDFNSLEQMAYGVDPEEKPLFSDVAQTEIPQLREHFKSICLEMGPHSTLQSALNGFEEISNDILMLIDSEVAQTKIRNAISATEFEAFKRAIFGIVNATNNRLATLAERHKEYLQESGQEVAKHLTIDDSSVQSEVRAFRNNLLGLHWMTLRATVANRGEFWSPSRAQWINLFAWVSEPLLNERLDRWTSLFTRKFPDVIESYAEEIQDELETFTEAIKQTLSENFSGQSVEDLLDNILNRRLSNNVANLSTLKEEISSLGIERSSELITLIENGVENRMMPMVDAASQERGTGMAARMRDTLTSGASQVLPSTFAEVAQDLAEKISEAVTTSQATLFAVSEDFISGTNDLLKLLTEKAPEEFNLDEAALDAIKSRVQSLSNRLTQTALNDAQEAVPDVEGDPRVLYACIDGSNVATSRFNGKPVTSLAKLLGCKESFIRQFPNFSVVTFVDSRFRYYLSTEELAKLELFIQDGEIVDQASGMKGGADQLILEFAKKNKGVVVSNDFFREWRNQYPFLREPGRHLGAKEVAGEWMFPEMHIRDAPTDAPTDEPT
jgi:hypothetical protein